MGKYYLLKTAYYLLLLVILGGCMTYVSVNQEYDPSEVLWSLGDGKATIEGDAFLMRNDGVIVKCSGREVWLTPVSNYEIELVTKLTGSPDGGFNKFGFAHKYVDLNSKDYKLMANDSRKTVCDIDGKFKFHNIPSGEYYLSTGIFWKINEYSLEGGQIAKRIRVEDKKNNKFTLTGY